MQAYEGKTPSKRKKVNDVFLELHLFSKQTRDSAKYQSYSKNKCHLRKKREEMGVIGKERRLH
jgi:hypothetical protein